MKKLFVLVTTILMTLSLVACNSKEELNAEEIYASAKEKMASLSSYSMDVDCDISIQSGEDNESGNMTMPMDMFYVYIKNGEDTEFYMEMSANFLGTSSSVKQWYTGGYLYADTDGELSVTEADDLDDTSIDVEEMLNLDSTNMTVERQDDNYVLTITMSGEEMLNMLSEVMGDMSSLFSGADINDPITMIITIDSEYYVRSMDYDLSLTVMGVTMSMDYGFTMADFDSAIMPELDKEAFDALDNDLDYEASDIMGDYDITSDDHDMLVALGYEDMGDNTYSNGIYYIDVMYKQMYYVDEEGNYYIYDWEYDEGFNESCTYSFSDGDSFGEGCEAAIEEIQSLREAFNNLAKNIKGASIEI